MAMDFSTLTDQELKDKLNELKGLSTTKRPLDKASLQRKLASKLQTFNVKDVQQEGKDPLTSSIADFIVQNGRYPSDSEMFGLTGVLERGVANGQSNVINLNDLLAQITETVQGIGPDGRLPRSIQPELINFINDQRARNELSDFISSQTTPLDESMDIKTIEDIISNRAKTNQSQANIDAFLGNAPSTTVASQPNIPDLRSELAAHTQDFIKAQYASAGKQFQTQIAPEIVQTLATRGLLTSGDLPSELASGAASSVANVEQTAAELMAQDTSFWEQAGYSDALRKAISAGQDVSGQIEANRVAATQSQEQRFKGSETALNRQQQLDLFTRQQQRALDAQTARLQRQRDLERRSRTAGLASSAGAAGGAIIGTAIAPGVGTTIGATGGATVGGLFGG